MTDFNIIKQQRKLLPLPADCVDVWEIAFNAISSAELNTFFSSLDKYEKSRAQAFLSPLDQQRFIKAHGVLRQILAAYLNMPSEKVMYQFNAYGKPYLCNTMLQFNLSHAGEKALLAITSQQEVGIDIEYMHQDIDYLGIIEQIFTIDERQYLLTLAEAQKRIAFYQGWSRKEAVIKALGQGLSYLLQNFSVTLKTKPAGQRLKLIGSGLSSYALYALSGYENYAAALAVKGTVKQINYYNYKVKRL